MCRYAKQDQPRPRRCFYLEDPCDQCEAEEQEKIDTLYEEYVRAKAGRTVINGHVIMRPSDCRHDPEDSRSCPICDGGLLVCMNCGTYESGLDDPCPYEDRQPVKDHNIHSLQAH